MFISDTHLPQLLAPDKYTSQEHYDLEVERLLMPAWHFVGCLDDLPNDGDYITCELLGHPLILWRMDGEVHTFLNVCAHRFSTLRDTPCGNMETLHCQYHGWEYDKHGDTRRIPDARSFRPMDKGTLGLTKFHTEVCGQVIYVNLSESPPTLEEALGPGYAIAERLYSPDRRLFFSFEYEVDANWKAKIENTLESYHIELIHPETFKFTPDEKICDHVIEPGFTTYETSVPPPSKKVVRYDRFAHRMAKTEYSQKYKHYLYYPAIMMVETGLITIAESVFPMGPGHSRILLKLFCYTGPRPESLRARILFKCIRHFGRTFFTQVAMEDAGILPSIQKGMQSRRQPSEGLISIREERINHFQKFIDRATNNSATPTKPRETAPASSSS